MACEFSGVVRDAFIRAGHDAVSCDLLPSESDFGPHIQGDVLKVLYANQFDLMIAHPPCTYLSVAGNAWINRPGRKLARAEAAEFFMELYCTPHVKRIAVENPVGFMNSSFRKPDQIINPWQFGESANKRTCIWLRNLPPLIPTDIVAKEVGVVGKHGKMRYWLDQLAPSEDRWKKRFLNFISRRSLGVSRVRWKIIDALDEADRVALRVSKELEQYPIRSDQKEYDKHKELLETLYEASRLSQSLRRLID